MVSPPNHLTLRWQDDFPATDTTFAIPVCGARHLVPRCSTSLSLFDSDPCLTFRFVQAPTHDDVLISSVQPSFRPAGCTRRLLSLSLLAVFQVIVAVRTHRRPCSDRGLSDINATTVKLPTAFGLPHTADELVQSVLSRFRARCKPARQPA
jgi:hypothetical protein